MPHFFRIKAEQLPGPDVAINCPACECVDTLADTYENTETVMLLWVLPTYRHHTTTVVCHACGVNLYSRLSVDQLTQATPDELDRSLSKQNGMLIFTLYLICLITLCIPYINLVPSLGLFIINRDESVKKRVFSFIPLVLALITSFAFSISLFLNYLNGRP